MDIPPLPDPTRRAGVRAFPIRLADGRAWGLALPSVRLRPEVELGVDPLGRPTETIRVVAEVGYPLEIRRLVAGLRVACDGDEPALRHEALFALAVALLRRAHDLDLPEATSLLELDGDDLPAFVDAVLAVVTGECPGDPKEDEDA